MGDSFIEIPKLAQAGIKFSTIVTSPRYNVGKDYGEGVNDKTDRISYLAEMYRAGRELLAVAEDDCLFFLNIGNNAEWPDKASDVCDKYVESGWTLAQTVIWLKSLEQTGQFQPIGGNKHLHNCYEFVFILAKDKKKYELDRFSIGVPYKYPSNSKRFKHHRDVRCGGDVWFIPYETTHQKNKKAHPAPFPVELAMRCIKLNGCKGPVLDPFSGIASVGRAAAELGVDYTMIDIVPANIEQAKKLLESDRKAREDTQPCL